MPDVLLVADEPWIRNQVRAALSDPDFTLREIQDPRSVVAAVQEFLADLVLVDLQVGTMGGMAVTREVRDAFLAGDIPRVGVVMVVDRPADTFLARRAGATACITKPFTPHALRQAVARSLPTRTQGAGGA